MTAFVRWLVSSHFLDKSCKVYECSSWRNIGPILLGYSPASKKAGSIEEKPVENNEEMTREVNWRQLPRHRDEDQVQLDVNRSFVYYPIGMSLEFHVRLCTSERAH